MFNFTTKVDLYQRKSYPTIIVQLPEMAFSCYRWFQTHEIRRNEREKAGKRTAAALVNKEVSNE